MMLTPAMAIQIRPAQPADVPLILELIKELALYERDPEAVVATEADLLRDGFGATPRFECLIAELEGKAAGFALYFFNYSTWLGRAGVHLEDLFVRPAFRGAGIGKALLARVAAITVERQLGRLQWEVLDWNQPAIDFYERIGAEFLNEWRIMRVTDRALVQLAGGALSDLNAGASSVGISNAAVGDSVGSLISDAIAPASRIGPASVGERR